jgi:hypothetical protein
MNILMDATSRGFYIEMRGEIVINKIDTDGLIIMNNFKLRNDYFNTPLFIDTMKQCMTNVDNAILERHNQNIYECEHQYIMLGSKKACNQCMGKFGNRITLDLNEN